MSFDFISKKFGHTVPAAAPKTPWWCDDCQEEIEGSQVTFQERHDERYGGCGCVVHPSCDRCENGGWVFSSYQEHPPNLEECPKCHNPFNRPNPC
jgi:hypothetical protein